VRDFDSVLLSRLSFSFAGTEISDYFIEYTRPPTFKGKQKLDDASEGLEAES
jgi:hypothetical protein